MIEAESNGQSGSSAADTSRSISLPKLEERLMKAVSDERSFKQLLGCQGADAQAILDTLQSILQSGKLEPRVWRNLIVAMKRLSAKTNLYPGVFDLRDVSGLNSDLVASGAFADVRKGSYDGQEVCLKTIRMYQKYSEPTMKNIAREFALWGQLNHPNLVPFYGLYRSGSQLSLVSAWASNGTVIDFLKSNLDANRLLLCLDITRGLAYLHENDVIHGDLKGENILIDSSLRAYIADFGLSAVHDPTIPYWPSQSLAASKGGTVIFQAPELLQGNQAHNTKASDVYAWSCVCYEIFVGKQPFQELTYAKFMVKVVKNGEKPQKPELRCGLTDKIWKILSDCWNKVPGKRPSVEDIIARFEHMQPQDDRPSMTWKSGLELRSKHAMTVLALERLDEMLSAANDLIFVKKQRTNSFPSDWRPARGDGFPMNNNQNSRNLRSSSPSRLSRLNRIIRRNTVQETPFQDRDTRRTRDEALFQDNHEYKLILVLGQSGSGKSTFINYATGRNDAPVGENLNSETQDVTAYLMPSQLEDSPRIVLVDAPGFNDTFKSDKEVMEKIVEWLRTQCLPPNIKFGGIIYLQEISQPRINHNPIKMSPMKFSGPLVPQHVILVTTKWSSTERAVEQKEEKERREKELLSEWQALKDSGAQVARFEDSTTSACNIIAMLKGPAIEVETIEKKMSHIIKLLPRPVKDVGFFSWFLSKIFRNFA